MSKQLKKELKEKFLTQAKEKINNDRISELDPTLGDNACQIRAFVTAAIAIKIRQANPLSEEEENYLAILEILSSKGVTDRAFNDIGFLKYDRSNSKLPKKILENLFPDLTELISDSGKQTTHKKSKLAKKTLSKSESETLILAIKKELIEYSIRFLQENSSMEVRESLLEDKFLIRDSGEILKLLPCFANLNGILESTKMLDLPIVLSIRRYFVRNIDESKSSTTLYENLVLLLKYDSKTLNYQVVDKADQHADSTTPALHVTGYNIIRESDLMSENPLHVLDTEEYLKNLNDIGFVNLFLIAAALHPQLPKSKGAKASEKASYETSSDSHLGKKYGEILEMARNNGIFNAHLSSEIDNTGTVAFLIEHIKCSSYREAQMIARVTLENAHSKELIRDISASAPYCGAGVPGNTTVDHEQTPIMQACAIEKTLETIVERAEILELPILGVSFFDADELSGKMKLFALGIS